MSVAKDNWYLSGPLGIDTLTPASPLAIRAKEVSEELISFEDPSGKTKWHINQNYGGNHPGLNFAETGFADGRLFIGAGGNIGIGTIEPKANLHVSGGAIINQIAIGLVEGVGGIAFPFWYETVGTIHPDHNLRLRSGNSILLHCGNKSNPTASFDNAGSMTLTGHLTVGTGSNGTIKVRHIDGKHHDNDNDDALHLNWNTGHPVHIGGKNNSELVVTGSIRAGNSDLYFTKTDHNHTGFGNTSGFAAIENAADQGALMILGRAGTEKGRKVRLWDYLEVNGDLDVTGGLKTGAGISYDGQLNKLDVAEGGSAVIRAHDLWFGHSGRRGAPGRALVDEPRELQISIFSRKKINTLTINYERAWDAVVIEGMVQTPSSRQLKENIQTLSSQVAKRIISTLEPISFFDKRDMLKLECMGFIAEDSPPEVASPNHDTIVYNHIVAALTKVVQDQQQIIEALDARLTLLEHPA